MFVPSLTLTAALDPSSRVGSGVQTTTTLGQTLSLYALSGPSHMVGESGIVAIPFCGGLCHLKLVDVVLH